MKIELEQKEIIWAEVLCDFLHFKKGDVLEFYKNPLGYSYSLVSNGVILALQLNIDDGSFSDNKWFKIINKDDSLYCTMSGKRYKMTEVK